MVLHVLLFLSLPIVIDARFLLYHSHNYQTSSLFFDCIYSSWIDEGFNGHKPFIPNNYLIPYCRRPDDGDQQQNSIYPSNQSIVAQFKFNQLNQQGISSNQLLLWSSSIDIVERYEMDRENGKYVFYNCSPPWFGEMCQYKFADGLPAIFSEIVQITFAQRSENSENISSGTCYRFLKNCDRGPWPLCLDWREICDGKPDCFDGEDEQMCEKLDLNECSDDEYRCHNGQCIPSTFSRDGMYNLDCLDGSDERELQGTRTLAYPLTLASYCIETPTFRCEERTSRYMHHFACGDGQYNAESSMPRIEEFCQNQRDSEINRMMITVLDYIEDNRCRQAFNCSLHANRSFGYKQLQDSSVMVHRPIYEDKWDKDCESLNESCTDEWLVFPEKPIMFGFFQFIYLTNRSADEFTYNMQPDFACFDPNKCPTLSCNIVHINFIHGLTCCYIASLTSVDSMNSFDVLSTTFSSIFERCMKTGNELSCVNPSDFFCNQSLKCISSHRVKDGYKDCYFDEDETFSACSFNDSNRYVCGLFSEICLSPVAIGNGKAECYNSFQDELIYVKDDFIDKILYGEVCTKWSASYIPSVMGEWAHCEWWPCNTPYVRCDKVWDCQDGADELNCPNSKCSFNQHECKNHESGSIYCLSIAHMFDKRINDCYNIKRSLYFDNESYSHNEDYYPWNKSKCITEHDVCNITTNVIIPHEDVCRKYHLLRAVWISTDVMHINTQTKLCTLEIPTTRNRTKYYFDSFRLGYFPTVSSSSLITHTPIVKKPSIKNFQMNSDQNWYCHRGILVLHSINQTKTCLCSPSYFGSRCQWQNQRVSLTFQIVSSRANPITFIFQLIIMLIDEKGVMTSYHEQLMYIPSLDCQKKFNLYLLYPTRPKHDFSNYSIRIDAFDKTTLDFWSSWYLPIPFQFMPVNRVSAQLFIPKISERKSCPMCGIHGKCVHYSNKNSSFYCQCDQGYSGIFCNKTYSCKCSNDSFCLSPSVCVCPLDKFGSYCYLKRLACESNPCQHHGTCVPFDDQIDSQTFSCFCKQGYYGPRCEDSSNQIILSLDETIISMSPFIWIHFVTARIDEEHDLITNIKKIPIHSNFITIRNLQSFNILFVQLKNQTYYLLVLRENFIPNNNITTQLLPKQRCVNITDLLNSTIRRLKHKERVRFYPQACRQNHQLMCFYDESFMCVCDRDRFANCFPFNYSMNNDCEGNNDCQNNGQYFQNTRTCPTISICVCEECFYGSKCELSSRSYIISLDPILGYHIIPNAPLNQQSSVVKVSIGIVTILVFVGLVNGLLSIMTFKEKKSKEVGCGYYLLISSIASILMIIALTIKFCHLLLSQMEIIIDQSVLYFNCLLIDVILKVLLSFIEWLIAYVAIERLFAVIQGVKFDKAKSRKMVKWIVLTVFLLTTLSHIHDPFHRQIIDDLDGDEKRVWCFVQYSSSMNVYNLAITLIHFIGPLLINFISTILIVKYLARHRSTVRSTASFKEELYQHKHLLLPPGMLVLLGTPRLVITFLSGCMRSARDPWLYVFGYFISYVPSILIFITFVLPSENYKEQFRTVVRRQLRRFRSR